MSPLPRTAMKQSLCAEAIGTLFLVMTVVGSGIMANQLSDGIDGLAPSMPSES